MSASCDAPAPASPVETGELVAGKYVVGECLAFGGMGIVYEARHIELEQRFALKFVRSELALEPSVLERFYTEAKVAASLRGEHVARVIDFGTLESGLPYLVMEHLEGEDLFSLLARSGPLPLGTVIDFVLEACEGLAEAHVRGLVHRDIKPENLFVALRPDGSGTIKLLDFGISKQMGDLTQRALTNPGSNLGSPDYMAPEQMKDSRDVDPRADIWSLGVVLFHALTGQLPFAGESIPEVCARVLTDRAPSLLALRPDLPPALDAIVQRCLAKRLERRFEDVVELARALAPFASPIGMVSLGRVEATFGRERPSTPSRRPSLAAVVRTPASSPPPPVMSGLRSRVPAIAAAVTIVAALVVTAWSVDRSERLGGFREHAGAIPTAPHAAAAAPLPAPPPPAIEDDASRADAGNAPAKRSPRARPPERVMPRGRSAPPTRAFDALDDLKLELEEP